MKKTINDLTNLQDKTVFVRVDFNVPLDNQNHITDNTRIQEALPTIKNLLSKNVKVILASHLGRPKGQVKQELRLTPVWQELEKLLPGITIHKANEVFSAKVQDMAKALKSGEILLLENLRFEAGEEKNDETLAKNLASLADIYVNDAFGAAHRAHASTEGIARHLEAAVAGLLMEREIKALSSAFNNPARPFTAIIGGSKVSTKISVLKNLIPLVDNLIIGGGMMFTFLKAMGYSVGNSLVEDDYVETAKELIETAHEKNTYLKLPKNIVVADAFSNDANIKTIEQCDIPEGWMGLDIAPESIDVIRNIVQNSKTVVWNGPLGVFEMENFANGTRDIANTLAKWTEDCGGQSILGGGDTVAAIEQFGIAKTKFTHVSTGGGASLEFMEGKSLPGIEALNEQDKTATAV